MTGVFHPQGQLVRIRDLSVTLGPNPVLRGVDLDLAAGEVVGLVGSVGSGKSTLLRVLAGLQPYRTGTVQLQQAGAGDGGRTLSWLSERPAGYLDLSGHDNLRLAGEILGVPAAVTEAVAVPDALKPHWRAPLKTYSTGMRRLVALLMGNLAVPRLVLMDEPSNGLDAVCRDTLVSMLRAMAATGAQGVIVASHDHGFLARCCDRIIRLQDGRVVEPEAAPPALDIKSPSDSYLVWTDDAGAAFEVLRAAGFIVAQRDADHIAVEIGDDPGRHAGMVAALVRAGRPVFGITQAAGGAS